MAWDSTDLNSVSNRAISSFLLLAFPVLIWLSNCSNLAKSGASAL
jgi:hypothetical protein